MSGRPLALTTLVFGCLALGQSPQRLVSLNVAAIDAKGDPVTDLQAAEVRIREDGKACPITFFRFAGARRAMAPPRPGEFVNGSAPPVTLILFDRWNERIMTAASGWSDIGTALQHLESVDRVYIYFLTNRGDLFPVHSLPSPEGDAAAAATAADLVAKLNDAVRKLNGFRNRDVFDPIARADTTFEALTKVGQLMEAVAGRKSLIWVTHGVPLTVRPYPSDQFVDFTPQIRSLSTAAAQVQIAMYDVAQSAEGSGADTTAPASQTLQMFAALTGGRFYTSGKAGQAITDAMNDARGNYRLAYYSPVREKDHSERKIRVESLRKGVRLRTRGQYSGNTPEPDTEDIEGNAFSHERRSPFDATEIGLRVLVSRGPSKGTAHLDIGIDPADILIERHGQLYQGGLDIMVASYSDGFLNEPPHPIHVDIHLTQGEFDKAAQDWIHSSQDVPVTAQIQKVRVMVFDRGAHGLGSVTVPMK